MAALWTAKKLVKRLERDGLLLLSDKDWPNLVALIVGKPVQGSWWGHPLGNVIYNTGNALEDEKDVLCLKLCGGKVTYLHARLWPDLLTLVTGGDDWQTEGVGKPASTLLQGVEKAGVLRLDNLPSGMAAALSKPSKAAQELEQRLLALSVTIHTESGAHARVLKSWRRWAKEQGIKAHGDQNGARQRFQEAVAAWPSTRRTIFPWT